MKLVDTHCHLDEDGYGEELESAIEKSKELAFLVNVGCSIDGSKEGRELAEKYEHIYFTAGVHPTEVENFNEDDIDELKRLALSKKCVAIGEIGMDYYRMQVSKEKQEKAFIRQIELARELNMPIVIHGRDCYEDIFKIIENYKDINFIMHSYAGHWEQLPEDLTNIYVSFSGMVTYPKNEYIRECSRKVPTDKLLVETDAPYLAPQAIRGRQNHPVYVKEVAKKIAEERNLPLEELLNIIYDNAKRVFSI